MKRTQRMADQLGSFSAGILFAVTQQMLQEAVLIENDLDSDVGQGLTEVMMVVDQNQQEYTARRGWEGVR